MGRLAESLRALREAEGMSQSELAEAVGVTRAYVSQLEHGRRKGGLLTLVRLAACLGVTIDELIGGPDEGS